MRIALCNEVLQRMEFSAQCSFAAALGYDGLEVAPFTLGDAPDELSDRQIAAVRRAAEAAGIVVAGLHWLLIRPEGLSLTSAEPAVRARTVAVMRRMVALCAALGGAYLVHGSPAQRRLPQAGQADARGWAADGFAEAGEAASRAGVVYCVEPLARGETNFINTVAEAAALVRSIGNPSLRTMLDTSAAAQNEAASAQALLAEWLPTGLIAHVQVNDRNRRGPGEGADRFAPVLRTLREHGYAGWVGVEPFEYRPDGPACAARAIGYLRGIEETLG
ncbi:MAG: sugar phosphate isomerase/epimerase [Acidisphaera sp.]|nr:sugar phosphate isomerase/epimerase [Acidisphaera sp.]